MNDRTLEHYILELKQRLDMWADGVISDEEVIVSISEYYLLIKRHQQGKE